MAEQQIDADTIAENAAAPRRASSPAGSAEQHPIPDQIAADRYRLSKQAARTGMGVRSVKLIPGNAD